MTWIVHVNRQHIAKNKKDGGDRPVYTIKKGRSGKPRYAREVILQGVSRCVYDKSQLSCGARAWIETEVAPVLVDEMSWKEAQNLVTDSLLAK